MNDQANYWIFHGRSRAQGAIAPCARDIVPQYFFFFLLRQFLLCHPLNISFLSFVDLPLHPDVSPLIGYHTNTGTSRDGVSCSSRYVLFTSFSFSLPCKGIWCAFTSTVNDQANYWIFHDIVPQYFFFFFFVNSFSAIHSISLSFPSLIYHLHPDLSPLITYQHVHWDKSR